MRVSVFGLGYVGTVSVGCLAAGGHVVVGVDTNRTKVDFLARGESPIIEPKIGDLIERGLAEEKIVATTDAAMAVDRTDLAFICVGTPSQRNGNLDLTYVRNVCEDLGRALARKTGRFTVAFRSTVLPGTTSNILIPILEEVSGLKAGKDFGVCFHPEFLREGSAVDDFFAPPKTVVGTGGGDRASQDLLRGLYETFEAPFTTTSIEVAEMVKYIDNYWHALKVGFGNEVGRVCKSLAIDSHTVMDIFFQDTKLNISPRYLKPGFAFGGSCLPKDLRALAYKTKELDLDLPVLNAILPSNRVHIEAGFRMITGFGKKAVGVLGLSFKGGTDDLRESPMVDIVELLLSKGYDVRIFDRNVQLASLVGANRNYILNHIPHVSRLLVAGADAFLEHSEIVVVGNDDPGNQAVLKKVRKDQTVVDFVRLEHTNIEPAKYTGIAW